jgi:glycine/D-amino acid oxidase-like deaminating enzyme
VVLATNAWAASLRELHTRLVVVWSDVVATAPIPERLTELGWTGGEAISNSALMVNYYRTTPAGRIVFGRGGTGVALGGRIAPSLEGNSAGARQAEAAMRWTYPALADASVEFAWSGPIDRPAHGLPLIGRLGGREHILYAVGWSGNGVAPSIVGAKILASLALGRRDEWAGSRLVDNVPGRFPPEPLRYAGAQVVRRAVSRKERDESRGVTPPKLVDRVAALAPGSFASGAKH